MVKRILAFIDGENLTARYQQMLKDGFAPLENVVHVPDSFVWAPTLTTWSSMDLIRTTYYTSVVGDDDKVAMVTRTIGTTKFTCSASGYQGNAQLIPRVHKKSAKSNKTKVVDVDIAIDVMRAISQPDIDGIFLVSGDGDYVQLIREVARSNKQIYVAALSSGLSDSLRVGVEQFVELDDMFVKRTLGASA
jgi:uncharacterized LabA/DUF88 family protein